MHLAKQLLSTSHFSIKEIAWQCGFNSLTALSHKFKQLQGCSPSEFRSQMALLQNTPPFVWKIPLSANELETLLLLVKEAGWLHELLKLILNNMNNEAMTVDWLAKELFVSRSNLSRKMRGLFSVPISRFIRDIKLLYAGHLLLARKYVVADIAYQAGFFDSAHLNRCFKQAFRCTPSEYASSGITDFTFDRIKNALMI